MLRRAFGCFPSGVAAICGSDLAAAPGTDGEGAAAGPVGMAVSTFTPVSLDPPLVSVCLQTSSTTWPRLRRLSHLGISVLGEEHGVACRQLSAREGDRFAGLPVITTGRGAVLLAGASAWLECVPHAEMPAGDHVIAVLRVVAMRADPQITPLVFHASQFRRLAAS
ncbi:flavin reductase family protein [Frankia canadensis]